MDYPKLHRLLLYLLVASIVIVSISVAYYLGSALLAGVVAIAMALVWIGWELSRISFCIQYIAGYIDGATRAYLSITDRQPH